MECQASGTERTRTAAHLSAVEHDAHAAAHRCAAVQRHGDAAARHRRDGAEQHASVARRAPPHQRLVRHAVQKARRQPAVLLVLPARKHLRQLAQHALARRRRRRNRRRNTRIACACITTRITAIALRGTQRVPGGIHRGAIRARGGCHVLRPLQAPLNFETMHPCSD
jgi:hypothetical protein